jgi:hypothetical protein
MRILFYNTYEKVFQNQDYPGKKSLMAVENITKLLGKICPIDRTEYIDHPFPIHPIPIPKAMPMSFDECMFLRAKEISEITEKKKILWSGGIDSTALLVALLKYDSEFDYEIVCTPSSLKEYPWFFEKYIKQKKHCIIDEKNPTVFFKNIFDGSYIITGHLGDQLFMNFSIVKKNNLELHSHWSEVFKLVDQQHMEMASFILKTHVEKSPVEIKTVEDIYWWIHFVFDWHSDIFRYSWVLNNPSEIKKHLAFYNTPEFQSWALFNNQKLKIHHWDNLHLHKREIKQYIYEYTHDSEYLLNKYKCNSFTLQFTQIMRHGNFVIDADYNIIDNNIFLGAIR